MAYVSIFFLVDVDHALRLDPGAYISVLVADDSDGVEQGVVEVDLVDGIDPAIADGHSLQHYLGGCLEGVVHDNGPREGWNVVPRK